MNTLETELVFLYYSELLIFMLGLGYCLLLPSHATCSVMEKIICLQLKVLLQEKSNNNNNKKVDEEMLL